MEPDRFAAVKEINGINLDNYFPLRSSYNTVIYAHKRVLQKSEEAKKVQIVKKKKDEKKTNKIDKAVCCRIESKSKTEGLRCDSVLHQTIRFAKNLVPLVIPPSESNNTPVFYTIKTCSKCKKRDKKPQQVLCNKKDDATFEKKRSKKLIETYRKEKMNRDSYSVRDSITRSSRSNTLDDVNMNQSLCCTLSDLSEKRDKDRRKATYKRKKHNPEKFVISESFEGFATELTEGGDTKIKIHLMNEKEKTYLTDNIRIPVLNAVRDCMSEFNNIESRDEVKSVQKIVKCNTQKLDSILDRLKNIEKYLVSTNANTNSPKKPVKASRLEQLGEDLMEEKEYMSDEDFPELGTKRRTDPANAGNTVVDLAGGEVTGMKPSTSVGVKTDRQNRLPARFCWTDPAKVN